MEPGVVNAVGIWFYSLDTRRYLYLMRSDTKNASAWALPGGKVRSGETLLDALQRECMEEIGTWPQATKTVPLEMFVSADEKFCYHTFFCAVEREFIPILNHEHHGWAWIDKKTWPRPMHPGLWATVNVESVMDKVSILLDRLTHHNS